MSGNSFIGGLRDDRLDSLYATDEELAAGLNTKINTQTFTNQVNTLNTSIATKADQGAVDSAMALKANQSDVDAAVVLKANQIYVDNQLNTKANQSEVDSAMALKANQSEVDSAMALKANQSDVDSAMALKANQSEVDSAMVLKANQSEVDSALNLKQSLPPEGDSYELTSSVDTKIANQAGLGYTQEQVNTLLDEKQSKPDTDADPNNRFVARNEVYLEKLESEKVDMFIFYHKKNNWGTAPSLTER